jgi:hypothetical protein
MQTTQKGRRFEYSHPHYPWDFYGFSITTFSGVEAEILLAVNMHISVF